ncbi:MAG: DUF1080 domain-containing protein [Microcystis novacekii Mn_MB_F_20050700_S1]|uniref:DUF1080 domain-containing protein n=1 Tax=Microcystis novacekii Mn_MB_F_20050700_S1D TaxID=2486266 RepID=A0A552IVA6_9CHRO|nr:MAG: DUF1080 domain-containing protein [Microcystis novacekii Mn_MB_F_20050700_S1D]TRU87689.1 MAG: DUF1080 domain-containing protein [Microcystis novacekii Mn_MB_F_20050700_S1]
MSQNESSVNNQDTSFAFGTDILGRYFCNTLEEAAKSNEARPFDLVVIGSGMYGSYIASKLYYWSKNKNQLGEEKRLKILILEAGPYIVHEHIENLPPKTGGIFDKFNKSPYICHVHRPGTDEKYFGEVTKHNYCVGGKSLAWGKWSPRLTKEALDSWPKEVRDFLYENYEKVEDETGVSDYSDLINGTLFKGFKSLLRKKLALLGFNHLKLIDPPIAVAANSTVSGIFSPDAFSSLGRLLQNIRIESDYPDAPKPGDPIWKSKSIFLVPNTLAYKLETDHGRVSRINVVDVNSKETRSFDLSRNCDVILAGTAVESTRLVLNSFPRSDSLKENQELIGRNLMGHLFSGVKIRIKRKALQLEEHILESALYHIQGYSEKFKRSYHFQFFCNSDPDFDVFTTLYKMFYDFEELIDTLGSQNKEWVTLLVLTCSEVQGKPDTPLGTDGSNWMNLSTQDEEFGDLKYRKPYLKWKSSPEDEEFWDEVHSTLFKFLSSLVPFGDIQYLDPPNMQYPDPKKPDSEKLKDDRNWKSEKPTQFDPYKETAAFWNSRHESGTLWMGEDPYKSVTDLDGKLHHIQNVYCADQAIFPTVGSANPVLTGLTLNRKIAQAIIDHYKDFTDADDNTDTNQYRKLFTGTFDNWKIQGTKGERELISDEIFELRKREEHRHGVAWFDEVFSEFELILDWRVFDYSANSGIIIHAPNPARFSEEGKADDPIYERGYEIQIDESGYDYINNIYGSPLHKTGAIYDVAPANRGNTKKPGYWNRFKIISSKSGIEVHLNGKLVSHLSPLLENKDKEGYICFQFHTGKIQFRNILIREHQKNQ